VRNGFTALVQSMLKPFGYRIARLQGAAATPKDGTGEAYDVQRRLVTNPNPTIFDVGAHIGDVTRSYKRLFPDACIHSFEPFPESYEQLERAVSGMPSIHCHRLAISDSNGTMTLKANASAATNSLLAVDERASGYWGTGLLDTHAQIAIETVTLDSFCAQEGIDHIDILKLDVQGAEFAVLEGAGELLSAARISLVYMELILVPTYQGQKSFREYLELFEAKNYRLLDFYNPVRSDSRLLQVDLIFVPDRDKFRSGG